MHFREKSIVSSSTGTDQSAGNDYQSDYDQFEVDQPGVKHEDQEEHTEKDHEFHINDDPTDPKKNENSKWTYVKLNL